MPVFIFCLDVQEVRESPSLWAENDNANGCQNFWEQKYLAPCCGIVSSVSFLPSNTAALGWE